MLRHNFWCVSLLFGMLLITLGTVVISVFIMLVVSVPIILTSCAADFYLDMTTHAFSILRNAALTGMVVGVATLLQYR